MPNRKITLPVIVICASIGIIFLLVILYGNSWIENQVKQKIETYKEGPNDFSYNKINVDVFAGKLSITNGVITNATGKNHYSLSFNEIEITGLGLFSYLFKKQFSFDLLRIQQPHIEYIRYQKAGPSTKNPTPPGLPLLSITVVQIDGGSFAVKKQLDNKIYNLTNGHFNISMEGLSADSTKKQKYNYFDATAFNLTLSNINHVMDSFYTIDVKNIYYNTNKDTITFDSIHLRSRFSKNQLAKIVNHEKDWLNIYTPSVTVMGFDAEQAANNRAYRARSIIIKGTDLLIFRDKRMPFPAKPDTKLLHQVMATSKIRFAIDTIRLKNATVEYQELVEKSAIPGKIKFEELYGTFYNLTNIDSIRQKRKNKALMDIQSKVMGKGLLKASFTFPLVAGSAPYTVSGNLGEMDMTAFNPMVKHVGFLEIKSGTLINFDFNFHYNLHRSNGEMKFEYEKLKIRGTDIGLSRLERLGQDIKSFLANTFIVNTDNLKTSKNFRVGKIEFERDEKKSIFNYWWKSLLTGLRSSTGITEQQ